MGALLRRANIFLMKTRILLLAVFFAFCGTEASQAFEYKAKKIDLLPLESYPAQITLNGVTIAADPFTTNEKSYTAFDIKNLNAKGYFPLRVIIRNDTQGYLSLRTRNIVLINAAGQQLYSTPVSILVEDVMGKTMKDKLPEIKAKDQTIITRPGSALVDFTDKELTNQLINPGSIATGFLFFFTPEPLKKGFFEGSTLYLPRLEEEGTHKPVGPFTIKLDAALQLEK
jgi:hypothetical protein